jgi:hypothetical protein
MSDVLRVQWTIIPRTAPQPWLNCNRCGGVRRFRTSDKIRVNANGKRLDAWLIYRCISCDNTWNRPILERQHVQTIDPEFLMSLRANEPALARRLASDVEELKRRAARVEAFDDVLVIRKVLLENTLPLRRLEILCAVPQPTALRVDRLLAAELHWSRSRIQRMESAGELVVLPAGSRLRRAVRDGTRLVIDLSQASDSKVVMAAGSVRGGPAGSA